MMSAEDGGDVGGCVLQLLYESHFV